MLCTPLSSGRLGKKSKEVLRMKSDAATKPVGCCWRWLLLAVVVGGERGVLETAEKENSGGGGSHFLLCSVSI